MLAKSKIGFILSLIHKNEMPIPKAKTPKSIPVKLNISVIKILNHFLKIDPNNPFPDPSKIPTFKDTKITFSYAKK